MTKFLNVIKKIQKVIFFIGLFIVGSLFFIFSLLPLISDEWTSDGNTLTTVIFMVLGLVVAVIGLIFTIRGLKTSTDEMNYFNKVEVEEVSPEVIESIRNSQEPQDEYYFHFCGKLNQSYIMETLDRKPIFECNCDRMGVVKPYLYTFKSHITNDEWTSEITHTVTQSYGSDNGVSVVDKSYFKIDGMIIWDYIGQKGYSIEPYLDTVAWSFKVNHYGIHVADIKVAGANILEKYEGQDGLRNIPASKGLYRVYCRESDIDAVAMIAFAVSRIEVI